MCHIPSTAERVAKFSEWRLVQGKETKTREGPAAGVFDTLAALRVHTQRESLVDL